MADITMCTNEDCPLAEKCYRQQAVASEYQYWAPFEYIIISDHTGEVECEHFYRR